jgi:hypothetical protein
MGIDFDYELHNIHRARIFFVLGNVDISCPMEHSNPCKTYHKDARACTHTHMERELSFFNLDLPLFKGLFLLLLHQNEASVGE